VVASVEGPRRSEVAVDGQVVPMTGEFSRVGRESIVLEGPLISVDLIARGQVGTHTRFTIEINGNARTEVFVLTEERQNVSFDFPFSDFGL
jgi:hypothetical protein